MALPKKRKVAARFGDDGGDGPGAELAAQLADAVLAVRRRYQLDLEALLAPEGEPLDAAHREGKSIRFRSIWCQ